MKVEFRVHRYPNGMISRDIVTRSNEVSDDLIMIGSFIGTEIPIVREEDPYIDAIREGALNHSIRYEIGGNAHVIEVNGGQVRITCDFSEAPEVTIDAKLLLKIIDEWLKFLNDSQERVFYIE